MISLAISCQRKEEPLPKTSSVTTVSGVSTTTSSIAGSHTNMVNGQNILTVSGNSQPEINGNLGNSPTISANTITNKNLFGLLTKSRWIGVDGYDNDQQVGLKGLGYDSVQISFLADSTWHSELTFVGYGAFTVAGTWFMLGDTAISAYNSNVNQTSMMHIDKLTEDYFDYHVFRQGIVSTVTGAMHKYTFKFKH